MLSAGPPCPLASSIGAWMVTPSRYFTPMTDPADVPAADQSLESLRFAEDRRRFVLTAALLVTPTIAFMVSEVLAAGNAAGRLAPLLMLRIAGFALAGLLILAVLRLRTRARLGTVLMVGSFLAVALALAVHALRPVDSLSPFFFELFLLVCLYQIHPVRWRSQAIAASALTLGVFVMLALRSDWTLTVERNAIITIFLAANVLGVVTGRARAGAERREEEYVEREQRVRKTLEETLLELRVLREILPICSHCRRVRDEHGAWAGLEEYIRRHTDSKFSHGICQDCAEQHLADVV